MAAKNLITIAVLLFLAFTATAQSVSLPFKTENALILVNVSIDGETKSLIFDTGAQRTIVHERDAHAERRGIAVGAGGYACTMSVIFIDMAIMPTNITRAVGKMRADGILGQDFLRHFAAIHINYTKNMITLE